ncbi:MAG: hypothetical protein Q8M07_20315 [Prosthecobacter sp.]|nr:hypothetical protein [Prosthecobacter sp.]
MSAPIEVYPYPRSPEAVRDVHRLLQLLKRERYSSGCAAEDEELTQLSRQVDQMSGLEVVEIFLNNQLLLARQLVR